MSGSARRLNLPMHSQYGQQLRLNSTRQPKSAQSESGQIAATATAHVVATGTALAYAEATVYAYLTGLPPTPVPGQPEPTNVPNVGPSVPQLTQRYTNNARTLTVSYPSGWLADETSSGQEIIVASSNRALANFPTTPAGEVAILIQAIPITPDIATVRPEGVVSVFGEDLQKSLSDTVTFRLSPPDTFQLGGLPSSRSFGGTNLFDLEIIAVRTQNAFTLMYGFCAPGEGVTCEDTLLAIAQSVAYSG